MPSNTPAPDEGKTETIPHWHPGINSLSSTKGVIHLADVPIDGAVNTKTKCGRYLTLLSIEWKEAGDRPCRRCPPMSTSSNAPSVALP